MDSNTHSTQPQPPVLPDDLAGLAAAVDELEAQNRQGLSDTARAERILAWRQLLDRQEGLWLQELAEVDACGAAGADQGVPAPSTAGWLRNRLRMGAGTAREAVQTARTLFRGPLPETAQALVRGQLSPAHARVLAQGARQLPDQVTREAEPVLVETASHLDPPRLRQAVGYLLQVADPDRADEQAQRRHERRGLWLSPTLDRMVAVNGVLEPEAGHTVLAALEPLARPADADDTRSGGQRTADALTELARRALEGGRLPRVDGARPQLLVTVGLDSLAGRPGEPGWGAGVGRTPGARGVPAAGLRRHRHPGPGQPPPRRPAPRRLQRRRLCLRIGSPEPRQDRGLRPRRARRAASAATSRHAPAPSRSWWGAQPAPGGRAGDPGHLPSPAGRPGRPRRWLCVSGL